MIVFYQTRIIIRTRKLLKEKELAFSEIERQREELELKNKNITDSLVYAKRIQEALLPSGAFMKRTLQEHFVFFRPKDIVSGDFYWAAGRDNDIFIATADCTGHGVPGALMSMIGIEILNDAVNKRAMKEPSLILDFLNRGLQATFNRESSDKGILIRDGMDIALIRVNRESGEMEFSGAMAPLYVMRDNNLIELPGDKISLGINVGRQTFTNKKFTLLEGDVVYLFSDGYVDQFGGESDKKFMYRRFRHLITSMWDFPMEDQKTILTESIQSWMGENEQVDDMMVIGYKPFPVRS